MRANLSCPFWAKRRKSNFNIWSVSDFVTEKQTPHVWYWHKRLQVERYIEIRSMRPTRDSESYAFWATAKKEHILVSKILGSHGEKCCESYRFIYISISSRFRQCQHPFVISMRIESSRQCVNEIQLNKIGKKKNPYYTSYFIKIFFLFK